MLDVSCSSEEYALHIREVQGVSLASQLSIEKNELDNSRF